MPHAQRGKAVHGHTRIRPRAVVWGLVVAACLFAAGPGWADQKPNPKPLWDAYPLDENKAGAVQNASSTTTQPPTTTARTQVTVTEKAGDGPPWALMGAAAAGGALFVVVLLTLQGRRARRRDAALGGVTDEWPWLTASSRGKASEFRVERLRGARGNGAVSEPAARRVGEAVRERERAEESGAGDEERRAVERGDDEEAAASGAAERVGDEDAAARAAAEGVGDEDAAAGGAPEWGDDEEAAAGGAVPAERLGDEEAAAPEAIEQRVGDEAPAFDVSEAAAVPRQRFDRGASAAAARRGPICQVHWSPAGRCFYAVTTDADRVEHRIAWSPPFEWDADEPPDEESREARAALRVLAKELRDKGWRPMRAKGQDFDEPRWYARRFRLPVAEDEEVSSRSSGSARA
jgi:hypothetical protein